MTRTDGFLPSPKLQIGDWCFEEERHLLHREDEERRLEPKAVAVLARLARQPGRVVSKSSLLESGWPGLHVGEEVLANAVYELRRAFGDDAREPRYIETIPRRGYRLVAPVSADPRPSRWPGSLRRWATLSLVLAAGGLGIGLGTMTGPSSSTGPPAGSEPASLVRRGWQALDSNLPDARARAVVWAEQALALDPTSSEAWALESLAWAERAAAGSIPAPTGYARSRSAAERALALDPAQPDALTARAVTRWLGAWSWSEAESDLRAAVERSPDAVRARTWLAELLFFGGRVEEARAEIAAAVAIAPNSLRVRLAAGTLAALLGEEARAREHFLLALERHPGHPVVQRQLEKLDERPSPDADPEDPGQLLAKSRVRPGHLAVLYAGSGDVAKALDWLERAVGAHDPTILFFRFDPRWDELRGHPRYRRAMRAAGIPS